MTRPPQKLHSRNIVAVIWDFDKTLTPGYMQAPLFQRYGIDEEFFWQEVQGLPDIYARRGMHVSPDTVYLNHLLSYIKNGPLKGLRNAGLRELGREIPFFPGLPGCFETLKAVATAKPAYAKHEIRLEHYIISTGLAEMIRGSAVAEKVDGIFACEFVECPLPPYYSKQDELAIETNFEISQIGVMVDNTIKTRYLFEINKGSNKNPAISVNAKIAEEDRRVPFTNMIYVADGPSDVPCFAVVRKGGGKTFAVYNPESEAEFAQNDRLCEDGRVHNFGPADYRPGTQTTRWLRLQVEKICDRIVDEQEAVLAHRVKQPPRHLHRNDEVLPHDDTSAEDTKTKASQDELFETQ